MILVNCDPKTHLPYKWMPCEGCKEPTTFRDELTGRAFSNDCAKKGKRLSDPKQTEMALS